MIINEHTALLGSKVLLVPYSIRHVPRYHHWMQDEELRSATASDPLNLEEEYSMQDSWRLDADKLTFIICMAPEHTQGIEQVKPEHDQSDMMIGDVNLFLYEEEEDIEQTAPRKLIGEIEIMIARRDLQGQGYGSAALSNFLWYIVSFQDGILDEYHSRGRGGPHNRSCPALGYLRVRIGEANLRSIHLFENLGFKKMSSVANYFGEVELCLSASELALRSTRERFSKHSNDALAEPRLLRYYIA